MRRQVTALLVVLPVLAGCGASSGDPSAGPPTWSAASFGSDAAGVEDGTRVQAPGIAMHPVSPVPTDLVGTYGPHGGCVPGYGRGAACLPPVSPAAAAMRMTALEMPWTCRDVRALIPAGLLLDQPGQDPLALDRDHDGRACGPSD